MLPTDPSVVVLRSNPVAPDPRVEKTARALHALGYRVRVVAWDRLAHLPPWETRDFGDIARLPIPAAFGQGVRNAPHQLRWQAALAGWLWRHRQTITHLHACDFDTILPALWLRRLTGARVIYDIFDFYADTLTQPALRAVLGRWDGWAISQADAVIVADERRLSQITIGHPRQVAVIYNSPEAIALPPPPLRRAGLRVGYIGILQRVRGLPVLLEVLARHPEWELVLGGFGGDEAEITTLARRLGNVDFVGRVDYAEALRLYAGVDVILSTYDPRIPNHRLASPNKLFEALMLGKPLVAAQGTGMDELVAEEALGWVVPYGEATALEAALRACAAWRLTDRLAFAARAQTLYRTRFAWPTMQARLAALYAALR
jgi:glycosyltransferase involved in cell wall biosynthesis